MNTTTLNALAEPTRLKIVELLGNGPLTVGEVADRLQLKQPQASKHLKYLLDSGLVDMRPDANKRICHLRLEPLMELDGWLESYRKLWEVSFDRLADYLEELQKSKTIIKSGEE
ncbi:transcriptional regulator [Paenibacillus agaridevorans]|uniref:Transcriptional regulator n=1 Tax=Paenibacillus agaridevorans TaxID=171404 RepID=A0A2R5ESP8_9BACL|nr:metalloregulator ArsR/SmtB family transcription factor [Paenibacillus agaridevorans]GBG09712.1 transcriptional regulator [Paenibacillus agaridevorans]